VEAEAVTARLGREAVPKILSRFSAGMPTPVSTAMVSPV
jgi:hypothetical protein